MKKHKHLTKQEARDQMAELKSKQIFWQKCGFIAQMVILLKVFHIL